MAAASARPLRLDGFATAADDASETLVTGTGELGAAPAGATTGCSAARARTICSAGRAGTSSTAATSPTCSTGRTVTGDLGPTDGNFVDDVYVRDLRFGITTLVSANAAGTDAGNSSSGDRSPLAFGPDGRIAYESFAGDLDPRTLPNRNEIFIATPPALADLGVTVAAAPDPVPSGGEVTITATATNHGPDGAEDAGWLCCCRRGPRSSRPPAAGPVPTRRPSSRGWWCATSGRWATATTPR
jgi:hypothetical protein